MKGGQMRKKGVLQSVTENDATYKSGRMNGALDLIIPAMATDTVQVNIVHWRMYACTVSN